MHRFAAAAVTLAVGLAGSAAARTPAVPKPVVSTRAVLEACRTGQAPADRYAIFTAQMAWIPHTARMQVRFELYERLGQAPRYVRASAPGLNAWYSAASAASIYRYRKQITALPAPGSYRAVVRFRWLDARNRVLQSARRTTAACHQPDLRPDLVPTGIATVSSNRPANLRYLVGIRNAGRGDAGPFRVALSVAGRWQPAQAVSSLAARASTVVVFDAPRCPTGSRLRVVLDTGRTVAEAREDNNVLTTRCVSPTTP